MKSEINSGTKMGNVEIFPEVDEILEEHLPTITEVDDKLILPQEQIVTMMSQAYKMGYDKADEECKEEFHDGS